MNLKKAGYIALETASFLRAMGSNVSIAVRSTPLRTFDSQITERLTEMMTEKGLNFLIGYNPLEIRKSSNQLSTVTLRGKEGDTLELEGFDCVVLAVGRDFHHQNINYLSLKDAKVNPKR